MTQILKRIGLFILPIFIISIPLDVFLSQQLKKSTEYAHGEYPTWNRLYNGNINSDIVIYGSSRAWVHIDPQMIEDELNISSYNLGIDGHNFWFQYFRHKLLIKYNLLPKDIIFSVDEFTFEKRNDVFNYDQLLPYMLYNDLMRTYSKSYKSYSWVNYYFPLVRYSGKKNAIEQAIDNFITPQRLEENRRKGFEGIIKEWNDDLQNAKNLLGSYEIKLDTVLFELFENFLTECDELGINVIMVYTPEYIEGQNFISNRSEINKIIRNFSKKYDIPYLDYLNHEISYKRNLFYNSTHLNYKGAKLFTKQLLDDLFKQKLLSCLEQK